MCFFFVIVHVTFFDQPTYYARFLEHNLRPALRHKLSRLRKITKSAILHDSVSMRLKKLGHPRFSSLTNPWDYDLFHKLKQTTEASVILPLTTFFTLGRWRRGNAFYQWRQTSSRSVDMCMWQARILYWRFIKIVWKHYYFGFRDKSFHKASYDRHIC